MHRIAASVAAATATLALLLAITATAVHADVWGDVNCGANPDDPRCTVEVVYVGGGGDGGSSGGNIVCTIGGQVVECRNSFGWLGSDGCYYGKDEGGFLAPNIWIRSCYDPASDTYISWGTVWLPNPPGALGLLTQRAVDDLSTPRPIIAANPALNATQVVHVPVWWWVQPGWWQTQTASASAGGITITARATPKKVTWYAGDGTSTVCSGPGTPWTAATSPTSPSPTCGHTYATTSEDRPGGTFQLRAVVTWDVTWSGGGLSGTVPGITTSTTTDITVTQLRAVITE